ncbi:ISL3 family transposase [Halopseudomonas pachastrellae]|nr:ISL3 family transposase [Halopseudomonas pachastrellae]WVM90540.1 ISL3 family transposase [Halopseudomonas pachastrellae]
MHDINTFLPFWEGFSVTAIRPDGDDLLIDLIPQPTRLPTCSGCHQPNTTIHEYCQRSIRDLPILGRAVRLNVELRRVGCSTCGKRMESVRWLDRYSRMTRRLADAVIQACQRLPTQHVAELFGLHWDSVRLLERRALQDAQEKLPKAQPRRLVMDEFALFKGHRYASVVLDADTRRVLWIGEGRSRAAVRPFFEALGAEGCARIEAVAMDMNTAFDLEVRQHCPQARVVYDLFHVIAKYGREVIDRVRVDEANRLRHDKPARKVIKQARWLLLRNPENLKREDQQVQLQDLLAANQSLMTVYLMKAELKALWSPDTAWGWRSAWKQWLRLADESAIPALQQFAKRLKGYWRGILSRVRWPMHTGQLEGINNRIKVIKRMAYGYRDSEFFFMKIKNDFPGNP